MYKSCLNQWSFLEKTATMKKQLTCILLSCSMKLKVWWHCYFYDCFLLPTYLLFDIIANGINPELIALDDVMIFFSGSDKLPPLGFPKKPSLHFNSTNIYPTASTCALELTLPSKYGTNYDAFKAAMFVGLKYHGGFGNL